MIKCIELLSHEYELVLYVCILACVVKCRGGCISMYVLVPYMIQYVSVLYPYCMWLHMYRTVV